KGVVASALQAAAESSLVGERAELSVTLGGTTQTVFVDDTGAIFTDNAAGTSRFQIGGADVTAASLMGAIETQGGSVQLVAAGGAGAATDVGTTYSSNHQVALSGKEVGAAGINDAIKAAAGGSITMT